VSAAGAMLLRWLWAGQWRSSRGRTAVAVVAIAVGVALGLAIHLVNRSALGEFGAAIAVVNGEAQAQLRASASGFDEALYDRISTDPDVRAASPVIETDVQWPVATPGARPITLRVVGLDPMRAAEVTPGLLPMPDGEPAGAASALFDADAIFLSPAALAATGARVGERVHVRAGLAPVSLRVAGTVPGAAAGQRIAVMDIGAAQWRLGWLGRLTRIDLRLADGVSASALAARLAPALPAGVVWSAPDAAQQRMSNLSRAYRVNLSVLALVALFTGGFLVYATLSLAVVRRTPELALLAVLGGTRRFLAATVLGQGAVLGAVGAALGTGLGVALAWATLTVVGGDLGGGFFQGSSPALAVDAASLALFGGLGVAVGLAASAAPAARLRTLAPARALKAGAAELVLRRRHALAWTLALAAAGGALLLAPPVDGLPIAAYLAIAAWLFAGIACVPLLARALGTVLAHAGGASSARPGRSSGARPNGSSGATADGSSGATAGATADATAGGFAWRHPSVWLAIERIRGAPGASAAALSGVVASFALASAMAVMVHSFRDSVANWLDTVLPADLYTRTPPGGARGALDPALQRTVSSVPGVARSEFLRVVELSLDAHRPPVALLVRPLAPGRESRQMPLTGELLAAPPDAVPIYASEAMVDLYGFARGRSVALPFAPGTAFFVAGVWRDYARQHGAIVIGERDYRRLTGDDSANEVALWLAPGADEAHVLAALRASAPALASLELRSARDIRALSLRIFDRSFALTYALEAIAIVVGLFGVASTYAGEALARAREFGMLRHLGVTRREIVALFAIESGALIAAGVAWGACIGAAIAMVLVHRVNPQSFHWTMDVAWPWGLLGASAAALVLLGVTAAVLASRSATGASPVLAVRQDW